MGLNYSLTGIFLHPGNFMGKGNLANHSAKFEFANPILLGEPNFNEYFANPAILTISIRRAWYAFVLIIWRNSNTFEFVKWANRRTKMTHVIHFWFDDVSIIWQNSNHRLKFCMSFIAFSRLQLLNHKYFHSTTHYIRVANVKVRIISNSLWLGILPICMHNSWFMIHKKRKKQGN